MYGWFRESRNILRCISQRGYLPSMTAHLLGVKVNSLARSAANGPFWKHDARVLIAVCQHAVGAEGPCKPRGEPRGEEGQLQYTRGNA